MTPRSLASRLLENDEDFNVSGEINRLTTSLHPDYEIESEGNHWNVYKKLATPSPYASKNTPLGTSGHNAFIGEITYDDMADMPKETMTPEQIAHWDTHRWMASAGHREEDRKFCASFKEAFIWVVSRNAEKRAKLRESEDLDSPDPYIKPDLFTGQPSEEKIESQLRVKLRPYYPDVRISKRPGMFHGRTGGNVKITDNYIWTIHCNRDTQLPLEKNTYAYRGSPYANGVDWRSQIEQWFRDWASESGLLITNFEIHGRLRKDPTFQFETTRLGRLKENEDDLSPESYFANFVDKSDLQNEILGALWKFHSGGVSYNAMIGPRFALVSATLYFPPEKDDFYKRFVEFVTNWITQRKLFQITDTKLTGGPHYPHDSNYPRWGLILTINMNGWPSDTPAYVPVPSNLPPVPTGPVDSSA